MSKVGFYFHNDYLKHKTGPGHPERPERLQHLIQHLKETDVFAKLTHFSPGACEVNWIKDVHPGSYIENIQNACKNGSWLPFSIAQLWPFSWWVACVVDHYSRRVMGFAVFPKEPKSVDVRTLLGRLVKNHGALGPGTASSIGSFCP